MGADGGKQFGMGEGETQRAVSSHGNAGDGPALPSRADAIFAFDRRDEFLQKEIAVAERVARRVDVETALAFRRHHQKVTDLMLAAQVFDHAPSAGAEQRLLVLAETVQEVEHGIAPRRRIFGVIVRRQLHAVVNRLLENAAVDDVAVSAALRLVRPRE